MRRRVARYLHTSRRPRCVMDRSCFYRRLKLPAADFWKMSAKLSCLFVVTEEDVLPVGKEPRLRLFPRWMVARRRMT